MNWMLLANSLRVAALATALAVAFGLMAALWLAGLPARWRNCGLVVAIIALALPPFLVANCWIYYLGQAGVWHRWLPLNIFSAGGTVWLLALLTWPITLFAALGAWQRLEAAQLESDPALGGFALLHGLLLPLARGTLAQATVLTFVLCLNNFAVPAILQEKVFPAELWVSFNTTFDAGAALRTSWPVILIPLLLLWWLRGRAIAWPHTAGTVSPSLFRQQLGRTWFLICGSGTLFIASLAVGLPLFQLASSQLTWSELPGAVAAGQSAMWNSVMFAAVSATICLALGLFGWRWPVGTALWIPFLVPGVLLGIAWIKLFNRPVFAAFYESAGIVIFALCVRYLAFGWNGASRALRATDPDLTDAARIEGASRWQLFRRVQWPQISPQIAAVWYIVFLLCLWDVESIVLIVPPAGETLALRIFNLLHYGHNPQVNALCLALLVAAVAPLAVWAAARYAAQWKRAGAMLALTLAGLFLSSCSREYHGQQSLESKIFNGVEVIGIRGAGAGEFNKPRSVAVDHQNNLYAVDMTGRVQKFSPDGRFLLSWQMPQTDLGKAKGMACYTNGDILVVEPHYQRVNLYSTDGKVIEQWGEKGTNEGQFIMPRAIAVNSRGDYILPEYTLAERVQIFSHDKKLIGVIGHFGSGDGEFNRPEGVCVDSADRIYVADSCNHRIQVFTPEGKFLRAYGKAGSGPGELSYPYDIRVDKAGRQYVCEFGNSRIQVFDANDRPLEIIGGAGWEAGKFSNPWSIALDSRENLYVADSQNHRVQKLLRRHEVSMTADENLPQGVAR